MELSSRSRCSTRSCRAHQPADLGCTRLRSAPVSCIDVMQAVLVGRHYRTLLQLRHALCGEVSGCLVICMCVTACNQQRCLFR